MLVPRLLWHHIGAEDTAICILILLTKCLWFESDGVGTFKTEYNATDKFAGFVTHSEFRPYVTEIGLYNDSNQLLAVGKLAKPIKESLSGISKNKFRVRFGHEVRYWKDTSVYFSGASTTFFHSLVKQTSINWEFFLVLLKKGDIQIRTGE